MVGSGVDVVGAVVVGAVVVGAVVVGAAVVGAAVVGATSGLAGSPADATVSSGPATVPPRPSPPAATSSPPATSTAAARIASDRTSVGWRRLVSTGVALRSITAVARWGPLLPCPEEVRCTAGRGFDAGSTTLGRVRVVAGSSGLVAAPVARREPGNGGGPALVGRDPPDGAIAPDDATALVVAVWVAAARGAGTRAAVPASSSTERSMVMKASAVGGRSAGSLARNRAKNSLAPGGARSAPRLGGGSVISRFMSGLSDSSSARQNGARPATR